MIIEYLPDIEFSRCIGKIYMRSLSKIYFQQSEKQYYLEMLIVTFRIFVAGVVTWYACSLIEVGNIVAIVVKLAVCIVLPNVIFILLNMRNKDFKTSMAFIKNVFHEIL